MRIAVTGSGGNIGRRLCPELRGDHDVVTIDLRDADHVADVRDFAAVKRALEGCDAVVHLGGISDNEAPWQPIYEANIGGTYNVYEAARQVGCRRIMIRAILAHTVRFAIVYGVGDNPNRFFDLEPGRAHYGFWPLGGAVPRE